MPIAFPVPPVCTAYWDQTWQGAAGIKSPSWARYEALHGVETEPPVIHSTFGKWYKTSMVNEDGDALYRWEGATGK